MTEKVDIDKNVDEELQNEEGVVENNELNENEQKWKSKWTKMLKENSDYCIPSLRNWDTLKVKRGLNEVN